MEPQPSARAPVQGEQRGTEDDTREQECKQSSALQTTPRDYEQREAADDDGHDRDLCAGSPDHETGEQSPVSPGRRALHLGHKLDEQDDDGNEEEEPQEEARTQPEPVEEVSVEWGFPGFKARIQVEFADKQ